MNKQVIICFHGFRTTNLDESHDFYLFLQYINKNKELYSGEVKLVNFYDLDNKTTFKPKQWLNIGYKIAEEYLEKGYTVYIVGYSVGAILAAAVASKYPVEKIILLSPAFRLLGGKLLVNNLVYFLKYMKLRILHPKIVKRFKKKKKKTIPISLIFAMLGCIIRYHRMVKNVSSQALIVLGLQDKYVPMRAANYALKQMKSRDKQLWLVDDVNHLFVFSPQIAPSIYKRLLQFIAGEKLIETI